MAFRALLAVGLLAVGALAQLSGLPVCAQTCVSNGAGPIGCSATDAGCLCASPVFIPTTERCASQLCTPDEIAQVGTALTNACDAVTGTGTSTGTFSGTRSDTSTAATTTGTTTESTTSISSSTTSVTSVFTPPTTIIQTTPTTTPQTTTSITTSPVTTPTTVNTGTTVPPLATPSTTKQTTGLTSQDPGSPIQTGSNTNGAVDGKNVPGAMVLGMIGAFVFAL
ncbi:hypothetical protein V5O48_014133 [Marasmius crinis-equi]|uniref:CFEM domain-containing protein n=1 Tax=Marasmius crinis-equi TaxID=585013 RepID=A0ABR3EY50_9AGAR